MSINRHVLSRRAALASLAGAAASFALPHARAQAYPDRPIRVIVPYPAGSATDFTTRMIVQRVTETWGKTMVVDNRPGAGATIGVDAVAKARADGYTVGVADIAALATNLALYPKLPYDATRDFAPIVEFGRVQSVLVAHPSLGVSTVPQLIALAKSSPGKITYASGGNGTGSHLAMAMFSHQAGINVAHIPYKGQPPALNDTLAGTTQLMFLNIAVGLAHIRSGKVRALGVASAKRVAALPDVPTLSEAGVPGYEYESWFGLIAPAGTPEAIVSQLNTQFRNAMNQPEVRARLVNEGGIEATGGTAAEFASFIAREQARLPKIVRDLGLQMN